MLRFKWKLWILVTKNWDPNSLQYFGHSGWVFPKWLTFVWVCGCGLAGRCWRPTETKKRGKKIYREARKNFCLLCEKCQSTLSSGMWKMHEQRAGGGVGVGAVGGGFSRKNRENKGWERLSTAAFFWGGRKNDDSFVFPCQLLWSAQLSSVLLGSAPLSAPWLL